MHSALGGFAALSMFALAGCFQFGDSSSEGSGTTGGSTTNVQGSFGAFTASLTLSQTTCGQGALGMPNDWSMTVGLGVDRAGACTWDVGSGPVEGSCAGAMMAFAGKIVIDMRQGGDGTLPACSIERDDAANLTLDNTSAPTSFSGTLSYTFTPTSNSDCADLYLGSNPDFATLPCTVQYGLSGNKASSSSTTSSTTSSG